jgi:hypothetical protein
LKRISIDMKDDIANVLAENLEAIEQGEITLGEALARHPQHREELLELLPLVMAIKELPPIMPRQGFRYTARGRILREISARQQTQPSGRLKRVFNFSLPRLLLRPALSLAILVVLLVATLSAGTVYAAGGALPGQALYPVKTTVEDLRLALSGEETDAALYLQFAQERLEEINALAAQTRYDAIPMAAERLDMLVQAGSQTIAAESLEESATLKSEALELNHGIEFTNAVLESLLDNGNLPGNSEFGIQRALTASSNAQTRLEQIFPESGPPGPPASVPVGPPEGVGSPDDKPEGSQGLGPEKSPGPPEDRGQGQGQDQGQGQGQDKEKDKPEKPEGPSKDNSQGPPPEVTTGPPTDKDKPDNSSGNPSNNKPDNKSNNKP